MLIRPDACVAWAGGLNTDGLRSTSRCWSGPAADALIPLASSTPAAQSSPTNAARARSFSVSLFSWPQAARMSRPRGVRTGLA